MRHLYCGGGGGFCCGKFLSMLELAFSSVLARELARRLHYVIVALN